MKTKTYGIRYIRNLSVKSALCFLLTIMASAAGQQSSGAQTEKQFVESPVFFNNWYLNPYGVNGFRDVAPGFFDEPFLNAYLNPADFPDFRLKNNRIYMDIRGWRYELSGKPISAQTGGAGITAISSDGDADLPLPGQAAYADSYAPYISLGYLGKPFGGQNSRWSIGAGYQLVRSSDPAAGVQLNGLTPNKDEAPVIQNKTSGHFASLFLAYEISPRLRAGFLLSGCYYRQRRPDSQNFRNSAATGASVFQDYRTAYEQDYDHLDVAAGFRYRLKPAWTIGGKMGYLKGRAEQRSILKNENIIHSISMSPAGWSDMSENDSEYQSWDHPGNYWYGLLQSRFAISDNSEISAFLQAGRSRIDLENISEISIVSVTAEETELFGSLQRKNGENRQAVSAAGTGQRKDWYRKGMAVYSQRLSGFASVRAGFGFLTKSVRLNSVEPNMNETQSATIIYGAGTTSQTYSRKENKTVSWLFESDTHEFMLPFYLDMSLNKSWHLYVGLNHALRETTIRQTDASHTFSLEIDENGEVSSQRDIDEVSRMPEDNLVERETALIAGTRIMLSENLRLDLLLSPRFRDIFHIQFWRLGMGLAL